MMREKTKRTKTETEMAHWSKELQLVSLSETQEFFLGLQLHPTRNLTRMRMRKKLPGAACAFYCAFVVPLVWP